MTQTRQVIGEGEGHLVVTVKLAERWPLSANFFQRTTPRCQAHYSALLVGYGIFSLIAILSDR